MQNVVEKLVSLLIDGTTFLWKFVYYYYYAAFLTEIDYATRLGIENGLCRSVETTQKSAGWLQ